MTTNAEKAYATVTCDEDEYLVEYYNNKTLSGSPVFTDCETNISYDWVATGSAKIPTQVGRWKLDENSGASLEDSSISTNSGTLVNGTAWTTGYFGSALNFDGTNDMVSFGDILDDVFAGADKKFSFSVWVKPGSTNMDEDMILTKIGDGNCSENERQFRFELANGSKPHFVWYNQLGNSPFSSRSVVGSTSVNNTSKWYHLVMTYDGSLDTNNGLDRVKLYVDGSAESTSLVQNYGTLGDIQDGDAHLGLGNELGSTGNGCGSFYLDGKIDDVQIYDRLLTSSEISNIYNGTNPVQTDNFGIRWTGQINFNKGKHLIETTHDDGLKLWINDVLKIDDWSDGYGSESFFNKMEDGLNNIVLEFYENTGDAEVSLSIEPANNASPSISTIPNQAIEPGTSFSSFDLDNYVTDTDADPISWSYSGNSELNISIDAYNVVVITYPSGWHGNENITFTATDPWGSYDTEIANFKVYPCYIGQYYAEYYNNKTLSGSPVFTDCETNISYDWVATGSAKIPTQVGRWKLDENSGTSLEDSSISTNSGTLVNGTAWTTGHEGSALDFDGTNDMVSFGDVLDDVFAGSNKQFSFSVWVKPGSSNMDEDMILTKIGDGNCSENERQFRFELAGGSKPHFVWYNQLGNSPFSSRSVIGSTSVNNTSKWYHLVMTYDGSLDTNNGLDRVKLYVDGSAESTSLVQNYGTLGDIQDGDAHLGLGNELGSTGNGCGSFYLDGKIDDVQIYDRLLTSSEISNIYNGTNPVQTDNFGIRWTGQINFGTGLYTFNTVANDGVKLWINNILKINDWVDGYSTNNVSFTPGSGINEVKLEFYENTGDAEVSLDISH